MNRPSDVDSVALRRKAARERFAIGVPRDWAIRGGALVVLLGGAILVLLPFFWLLSTALKPDTQLYTRHFVWISNPLRWQNFTEAWTAAPFNLYLTNTMTVEISSLLGTLLSCSLAAYGFARLRFPGRNIIFMVLLSTLMLPSIVTTIPLYLEFRTLGWLNTFLPLIVPSFGGNAFFIFLLRQFLLTIPLELEDAARVDGCGWLRIWWSIILPLTKPALAAVTIFQFLYTWNDFFGPLIYLTSANKMTLALGLLTFLGQHNADWTHLMAMSVLLMLPPTLLFFLTQRYFIQGVVTTGLGGR